MSTKHLVSFCAIALVGLTLSLGACVPYTEETDQAEQAAKQRIFCGGIASIPCPDGLLCVDDPKDDCDPANGGADCGGICVRPTGKKCEHKPSEYVAYGDTCMVIRFFCPADTQRFEDSCGCGCEPIPGEECNGTVCGAGEYCCNYSCSICAPAPDGMCTEQFCGSAF